MARVLALLAVLTVIGGVLRFQAAADPSAYQSRDEQSYAMLARWMVVHHEYGPPGMRDPAHWPPGAPVLFAVAYRLDPELPPAGGWDVPSAYRLQALVGTLTIPAVFLLGLLVMGPAAGLLAAAGVALYPPLIEASGDLLSEPLGALLLTSALAATAWALRRLTLPRLALAGALLGATIVTRADLALAPAVAAIVVGVVAWRRAERRPAVAAGRAVLAVAAATLVVVAPWTIVASNASGRFVPLSSGGASNLWVGTFLPGDGTMFGAKRELAGEVRAHFPDLARRRWFQLRQADVIATVAARHPGVDRDAALGMEARRNLRRYAIGDPPGFAAMAARKIVRLWGGYTVGTYGNMRAWITAMHVAIVLLGFAGLAAGLLVLRTPSMALLALMVLYVTAVNAVLVSEARHNLTLMPAMAVAAASAIVLAAGRVRARAAGRAPAARDATPAARDSDRPAVASR